MLDEKWFLEEVPVCSSAADKDEHYYFGECETLMSKVETRVRLLGSFSQDNLI